MPPIFSDLELARRLERAEGLAGAQFVDARARIAPSSGAEWIQMAGVYAMFDGVESPLTQTFGLGLGDGDANLDRLEAFFRERGAPVFHEVCPLAGVPLLAALVERGYKPVELTNALYRPLNRAEEFPASNGAVSIRNAGKEERMLWAEIAAEGWGETPELRQFLLELTEVIVHKDDSVLFLADLEGRPVACAGLSINGGLALMAGACTIPGARRQGAQLALLHARLSYASRHGCDVAMMCAQPGSASQRNAERHGFRIAYTRTKWGLTVVGEHEHGR